jgi:hypothetical protein
VNSNFRSKRAHPAVAQSARKWDISREDWAAYEQDLERMGDYERWIAEMEREEAGDAANSPPALRQLTPPSRNTHPAGEDNRSAPPLF